MIANLKFKLTPARKFLIALVIMSLFLIAYRLFTGLGVATNLNDTWPWGLWIGADLSAVALAGAGYSVCVLVHIMNIKRFKVVARRALLFSFMGYIFVLATLILEIGRWENFWRPFYSWGYHSPMFEVFMCISAYTLVQMIELAEIITEERSKKWFNRIKKIMPVVIIAAAVLPFGHQASLGAIYSIAPHKLHPLWWSPLLPWFFLITSFFVGPAIIALEALWSGKIYNNRLDTSILKGLMKVSGGIMVAYLALKIYDLVSRDAMQYLFSGGLEGNMFIAEMIIGVILPIIICFSPFGSQKSGIATFGVLTSLGIIFNRANVVFSGMYNSLGPGYTPNLVEIGITIGLLALAILGYIFIVENFEIYEHKGEHTEGAAGSRKKVQTGKPSEVNI